MKIKTILLLLFAIVTVIVNAQNIGINSTGATPDPSASLDIDASPNNNTGLLIPRIPLLATNIATPVTSPAIILLVYNTATVGSGTAAVLPGYYYWSGTQWVTLGGNDWHTNGNIGTAAGTNFLGTTDAVDFVVKTNNTERMRVLSTGNVGIGTLAPASSLHIVATATNTGFQLQDGTEGLNKILTSDAAGKASWQIPIISNIVLGVIPATSFTAAAIAGNNDFYSGVSYSLTAGVWEIEYQNWGEIYTLPNSGFFYTQLSTSNSVIISPTSFSLNKTCLTMPYFNGATIVPETTRIINGKWMITVPVGGQVIFVWNGVNTSTITTVAFMNMLTGAIDPYSFSWAKKII